MMRVDLLHDARDFRALLRDDLGVWRDDWDTAVPVERAALLREHRRRLLVATPEGRIRLRRWLDDETPLPPMSRCDLGAYVQYRVGLFGDESFLPDVIAGLVALPDAVRAYVLRTAAFLGVGRESVAWTASARLEDVHGSKRRIIVLGCDANARTIRHESWHVWHAARPVCGEPPPAVSATGAIAVRQLAHAGGWLAAGETLARRHERLAEAGVIAWGDE